MLGAPSRDTYGLAHMQGSRCGSVSVTVSLSQTWMSTLWIQSYIRKPRPAKCRPGIFVVISGCRSSRLTVHIMPHIDHLLFSDYSQWFQIETFHIVGASILISTARAQRPTLICKGLNVLWCLSFIPTFPPTRSVSYLHHVHFYPMSQAVKVPEPTHPN